MLLTSSTADNEQTLASTVSQGFLDDLEGAPCAARPAERLLLLPKESTFPQTTCEQPTMAVPCEEVKWVERS
jgi:hypothetical protein